MMKRFLKWLLCSFERGACGASSKKITMFIYTLLVVFLHTIVGKIFLQEKFKDAQTAIWLLLGFLIVDSITILMIMNIVKAQDIINFKDANGSTNPPTTNSISPEPKIS